MNQKLQISRAGYICISKKKIEKMMCSIQTSKNIPYQYIIEACLKYENSYHIEHCIRSKK